MPVTNCYLPPICKRGALNNKNQLFTRSQILNKVWGYDYYGDGRAVDTYIKKLRKKLGVHSHRIQTIMKAGYTYTDEED